MAKKTYKVVRNFTDPNTGTAYTAGRTVNFEESVAKPGVDNGDLEEGAQPKQPAE